MMRVLSFLSRCRPQSSAATTGAQPLPALRSTVAQQTTPKPISSKQGGFSLVELMIAMVLGLVLIGGVVSVFLSNSRTYQTNTSLGGVQANARIAFELLARDIRQAGLIGCNSDSSRLANVLNNGPNKATAAAWWADWDNAVRGFDGNQTDSAVTTGSGTAERVNGTSSLMLLGAKGPVYSVESSDVANATITLGDASADVRLKADDIVLVCDPSQATLVQLTGYAGGATAGPTMTLGVIGNAPGNCSQGLGFPTNCDGGNGTQYSYIQNSMVSKYGATDWFIGNNPAGSHSLYRITEMAGTTQTQEMVRNVSNMTISYHQAGSGKFADAADVGNWGRVDALKITLTIKGDVANAGTAGEPLERTFTTTTAIRNRVN